MNTDYFVGQFEFNMRDWAYWLHTLGPILIISAINALPDPTEKSSAFYVWFHKFIGVIPRMAALIDNHVHHGNL